MQKLQNLTRCHQYAKSLFCKSHSTVSSTQKLQTAHFNDESFEDLSKRRQTEALRSIMVKVNTKDECNQIYHHCKQFGEIKNAFLCNLKDDRNLMLLEYENGEAVHETFKSSGFRPNTVKWPNRVLTVRRSKLKPSLSKDAPLQIDNVVEPPVADILRNANSFDEKVNHLFEHTQLTDLSIRLRYITALQAQTIINEHLEDVFPNAKIYPFGSTINGFGKMGCDLDMVLRYGKNSNENREESNDVPLAFDGKKFENAKGLRKVESLQVKWIASIIDCFVPGCSEVAPFRGTRVPIVRYLDNNIHCGVDLSINNLDGIHMTEFMYAMGLLDPRIRPFIFMVRRWANELDMSRHHRREHFRNFQLTYLKCKRNPLDRVTQRSRTLIQYLRDFLHPA